ncbi:MAG: transketolase [Rhodospirillales bacterium CG15_BIG_FIL_POST_REV_8_21_14_020_66_15]|nr:MAG: transketolase [Rhodospirillales bacterium CG15_BIG_FIL_POST_REV_8_21_14_020_66_15]
MAPLDTPNHLLIEPNPAAAPDAGTLARLTDLQQRILWLSTWTIHNANHVRAKGEVKVGGHQASCASSAALMTALYFHALRPQDRVAVKPHASPVFHAIQYLMGNQTRDKLENFRGLGGAQSYPSRTKDTDDVDFSTGSVGLGPAMTMFASLTQDYTRRHFETVRAREPGRMIAVVGDAEMDEGNMYEAILEGWKHNLRNCWWIIDYNRQSLDGVVNDKLFRLIDRLFRAAGWRVVVMKYGKLMRGAFQKPGGKALKKWINDCPNDLYAALTFQGGRAWRDHLGADIGGEPGVADLLAAYTDDELQDLMSNLGGHCLETICEAFSSADDEVPTCFLAYTIKGWGLPLAGHKDNHAGILTPDQLQGFRKDLGIREGEEWEPFAGMEDRADDLKAFIAGVPFMAGGGKPRRHAAGTVAVPEKLAETGGGKGSTQEAFGKILFELAATDHDLADRIVTTSPDVTVSTNLGPWVNRRGIFAMEEKEDTFRKVNVPSVQKWGANDEGQHLELGIAENNLFLALAALGLSHELFGERLLPVGTLYDPFIQRGLDALNYACYQDARFMVVATPAGVTLAPEGGAHQSVATPMIGMGQPGLSYFEPAFADELQAVMRWGFEHMQAEDGGSVYLRLSTRPLEQPKRAMDAALADQVIAGAYWLRKPASPDAGAIVYTGAVAPEALAAAEKLAGRNGPGVLAVTSPDRLYSDWRANGAESHAAKLLAAVAPGGKLVTVIDGHPATLSWLGGVAGHRVAALGVEDFGQCGTIPDLYRKYGLDAEAIAAAYKD